MKTSRPGIYVHTPFCLRKCAYCDFYSITDLTLISRYFEALRKEIALLSSQKNFAQRPDTLYFGGGTPSLLSPGHISLIIDAVHDAFGLCEDSEITLEANPGTLTKQRLLDYRSAGVNRLNLGVQSFSDDRLRFLARVHCAKDARQSIEWSREAGFNNLGLDLIYALPGQSQSDWQAECEAALAFSPEHLSCYMLTYEPGTQLDDDRIAGNFEPIREDDGAKLFSFTSEFLSSRGYEHYEISNFAKGDSARSRHNQKYWNLTPYIGLGPSAHSFLPPVRRWNSPSLADYIHFTERGELPPGGQETLTREQKIIEFLYLGLRTRKGVDIPDFERRFNLKFKDIFAKTIADLEARKLLRKDSSDHCALSIKGMVLMDHVLSLFMRDDFE